MKTTAPAVVAPVVVKSHREDVLGTVRTVVQGRREIAAGGRARLLPAPLPHSFWGNDNAFCLINGHVGSKNRGCAFLKLRARSIAG
jgi:hypothetical protein